MLVQTGAVPARTLSGFLYLRWRRSSWFLFFQNCLARIVRLADASVINSGVNLMCVCGQLIGRRGPGIGGHGLRTRDWELVKPGAETRRTSTRETASARAEKVANLAIKGPKRRDFGPFLLVFATRILENAVEDKGVKCTLHQTKCSFFRFMWF